jgi:hypothetical protein
MVDLGGHGVPPDGTILAGTPGLIYARVIGEKGTMDNASDANPESAPSASATDLFRALVRLRAEGRIAVSYDFARLGHIDCPVASEADGNIFAYAVVAIVALAWWRFGWKAALAVAAAGAAVYFSAGRYYIRRRIRHRIDERAFASLELWQRLWRFGGIALTPAGGTPCVAPGGNWMALVRGLGPTGGGIST